MYYTTEQFSRDEILVSSIIFEWFTKHKKHIDSWDPFHEHELSYSKHGYVIVYAVKSVRWNYLTVPELQRYPMDVITYPGIEINPCW